MGVATFPEESVLGLGRVMKLRIQLAVPRGRILLEFVEEHLGNSEDRLVYGCVGRGEVAPVAGLDSQDRQGSGEVGLATSGLSEEQDGPAPVNGCAGRLLAASQAG
jgi:hypothetical protein